MYKFLFLLFFLFGCSESQDNNPYHLDTMYGLAKYEYIFDINSNHAYLFKGMIFEHVYEDKVNAYKNYEKSNGELANKRMFLYCFLYCDSKIRDLYNVNISRFLEVEFIYSLHSILNGQGCGHNKDVCKLVSKLVSDYEGLDVFGYLGKGLYEEYSEQNAKEQYFELVYYLLKKSSINGSIESNYYISEMFRVGKWLPKDCEKYKEMPNKGLLCE